MRAPINDWWLRNRVGEIKITHWLGNVCIPLPNEARARCTGEMSKTVPQL